MKISELLPADAKNRKWTAIGFTVILAGMLTVLGIYGIGEYGLALFVLTPLFIGCCATVILGYQREITRKEARSVSFLSLGIFGAGLLLFAMEGVICIVMASPLILLLTWAGSLIGYGLTTQTPGSAPTIMLIFAALIPATGFVERSREPELTSVVTSIEINADPETVWKNVVEFPQLEEPTEFIFKTGIAYPVNAKIEGSGGGAIRYCNFTTGSFIEPITTWDEPTLLQFDVRQQPAPMKELSFWDVDAPHLHDFFVSKKGQFKLVRLSNGNTLLEGTTWYYHKISPAFYWQIWSDQIIHAIHKRVLAHIKKNAERR
jgi:hypothetical protein